MQVSIGNDYLQIWHWLTSLFQFGCDLDKWFESGTFGEPIHCGSGPLTVEQHHDFSFGGHGRRSGNDNTKFVNRTNWLGLVAEEAPRDGMRSLRSRACKKARIVTFWSRSQRVGNENLIGGQPSGSSSKLSKTWLSCHIVSIWSLLQNPFLQSSYALWMRRGAKY